MTGPDPESRCLAPTAATVDNDPTRGGHHSPVAPMTSPLAIRRLPLDRPLDLRLTLGPTRMGRGDPSTHLRADQAARASHTPAGPVALHLTVADGEVVGRAWGPGADWALEQLPGLIGAHDTVEYRAGNALIDDLVHRIPGLRMGRTDRVLEALVPAVCAQGVSGFEAKRAHLQLIAALGEDAPGPPELKLRLPPSPRTLASVSHQDLHLMGLEQARADVIRRAAARGATVESLIEMSSVEAEQRLRALAGVSVWTAAVVRQVAMGDPDAVPVGDPTLKHIVAWAFTGERRGNDAQMLELLEPFRGQRARVLRLLKAARLGPPVHGADDDPIPR